MNGNGSFGGVLIAPNATVKLNGTFNFYGALEVGTISQISGNFSLAYDSELSSQQYTLPAVVSGEYHPDDHEHVADALDSQPRRWTESRHDKEVAVNGHAV